MFFTANFGLLWQYRRQLAMFFVLKLTVIKRHWRSITKRLYLFSLFQLSQFTFRPRGIINLPVLLASALYSEQFYSLTPTYLCCVPRNFYSNIISAKTVHTAIVGLPIAPWYMRFVPNVVRTVYPIGVKEILRITLFICYYNEKMSIGNVFV